MALINILLQFDNINVSLQVGDIVYYTYGGQQLGGFDNQSNLQNTKILGEVMAIDDVNNTVTVRYDDTLTTPPPLNSYISFVKNQQLNTSSVLGYYAEINFVNDSEKEIELFNVGSEVTESSK
tara:strand:+ start:871 stop:1239 length:369 start_codon:yes stop_codon:yes gene_type:complete